MGWTLTILQYRHQNPNHSLNQWSVCVSRLSVGALSCRWRCRMTVGCMKGRAVLSETLAKLQCRAMDLLCMQAVGHCLSACECRLVSSRVYVCVCVCVCRRRLIDLNWQDYENTFSFFSWLECECVIVHHPDAADSLKYLHIPSSTNLLSFILFPFPKTGCISYD